MDPVQKPAVHELVVKRLRQSIHLGDFLPGDRLPSEREIAERLRVSRESVRDAIKILESEGYIVVRRGATGGIAVTALEDPVARMLVRLRENHQSIHHIMDFRRANECLAAGLAARHRTREDLRVISMTVHDLSESTDIPRFRRADSRFHLAIAAASRNPHLERAIADAREAIFLWHHDRDYDLILDSTLRAHQNIRDAIEARDEERAAEAMDNHLLVAVREIEQTLGAAGPQD